MTGAFFGAILFLLLATAIWPRAIGRDARKLYDKFMDGWTEQDRKNQPPF